MNSAMDNALTFRILKKLGDQLKEQAKKEDRSVGYIVRKAVALYLEKQKKAEN